MTERSKSTNGSGVSAPNARELDALRTGKMSVNAALLELLRSDLLSGRVPAGVKLKIPELCERYTVSPGSVREALSRLVAEGLVDVADQRGFWSTAIDLQGLHDITRVRILIEREALTDAMRHGDLQWEERVRNSFNDLCSIDQGSIGPRPESWRMRHKAFHLSLVSACTSPWLVRMHELLFDQTERYRLISAASGQITHAPNRNKDDEHGRLAEAIISRKAGIALFLMEAHLRETTERVEATIAHSTGATGKSRADLSSHEVG